MNRSVTYTNNHQTREGRREQTFCACEACLIQSSQRFLEGNSHSLYQEQDCFAVTLLLARPPWDNGNVTLTERRRAQPLNGAIDGGELGTIAFHHVLPKAVLLRSCFIYGGSYFWQDFLRRVTRPGPSMVQAERTTSETRLSHRC